MRHRAIFSAIAFVFSAALLVAPGQAPAAGTSSASSFGGGPKIEAADFDSNGDLIQTWYWLRDSALSHYATWRIDRVAVPSDGVRLSITALATEGVNGGPGVAAEFSLRYGTSPAVLDGRGGSTMSVRLPNVSPPNDPVGYTNHDVLGLPAATLGGFGRTVRLYLRVERETARGPHVAFNAGSMSVEQKGVEGTEDGGFADAGGYWTCSAGEWIAVGHPRHPMPLKLCGSELEIPHTQFACEQAGGSWGPAGLFPKPICRTPTRDAGRPCADVDECEGLCLAALTPAEQDLVVKQHKLRTMGTCTPYSPIFGCMAIVKKGFVTGIECRD